MSGSDGRNALAHHENGRSDGQYQSANHIAHNRNKLNDHPHKNY